MTAYLDAFMADHAGQAWAWGAVDCSLVLADWAIANGHADPAAAWRGAYADELAWRRIVTARSGLLPLVSEVCARAGLAPTETLARGIIGVIGSIRHPERQWGAIYDGARWQVRGEAGFGPMTARALGMWSV